MSSLPRSLVRALHEDIQTLRRFGPKALDHPTGGTICAACDEMILPGDYTTLITLGPGNDPDAQEQARTGNWYNARAIEIHWACATGNRDE